MVVSRLTKREIPFWDLTGNTCVVRSYTLNRGLDKNRAENQNKNPQVSRQKEKQAEAKQERDSDFPGQMERTVGSHSRNC